MAGKVVQWVQACCWVWLPEFDSHDPHDRGRRLTLHTALWPWCVLPHVGPFIRVNVMKNIFKRKENTKLPLVHILFQITEKFRTKIGQTSEAKCVGFCGGES